ncbi:Fibronectin type III superfamily [Babesia duncani]|uniref:Fibronectin type III superfamily n=1 Tax=Babesia duncani TaxID=323732 RepID=A0AAD9PP22_9APIC|nr:Fibronectin type III superfamily [Babesia duncani]
MDIRDLPIANLRLINARLAAQKQEELANLKRVQDENAALHHEASVLRSKIKSLGGISNLSRSSSLNNSNGALLRGVDSSFKRPLELIVEFGPNFTCTLEIVCHWNASQLSAYFNQPSCQLQYKVILIETTKGIVDNASTITVTRPILTLTKLQFGTTYHVVVHASVGKGPRLVQEKTFVYKEPENPQVTEPSKSDLGPFYIINVQVGPLEYFECKFMPTDDLHAIANEFVQHNKLKQIIVNGLVASMESILKSNVTLKTVDIADLIP